MCSCIKQNNFQRPASCDAIRLQGPLMLRSVARLEGDDEWAGIKIARFGCGAGFKRYFTLFRCSGLT